MSKSYIGQTIERTIKKGQQEPINHYKQHLSPVKKYSTGKSAIKSVKECQIELTPTFDAWRDSGRVRPMLGTPQTISNLQKFPAIVSQRTTIGQKKSTLSAFEPQRSLPVILTYAILS